MNLEIDIKDEGDSIVIISLNGDFDVYTVPSLKQVIIEQTGEGKNKIIIDLTDIQYLDQAGLEVLGWALKRAHEEKGNMVIVCSKTRILRIFEITCWGKIIDIFRTQEEALEKMKKST